ncbi:hypothetical protein QUF50_02340 [Thiotrichales bacterium HSG1]|nr:hypothetical protein [Thiotrichales bacterium HSG1]
MAKIGFNLMQLIEYKTKTGERIVNPNFDTFTSLGSSFHMLIDDVYYEIKVQKEKEYIWFEFDYGKPNPIDNKLTNINSGRKKNNHRKNDEAELTNQLFVLYYFNKNMLYLSNLNKEKIFENMIQEKLSKTFEVKRFFKSKDDFISILKEVNEISFTEAKDLFNKDSKKRQALIDLTGVEAPEKFTLDTKYPKGSKIVDFILGLIKSREQTELNELVIRGTDNNNFDFVFNVDTFVQKIYISCDKENNGKFDPNIIKNKLLGRLHDL